MLNLARSTPAVLRNAAKKHLDKKQYGESELYIMEALKRDTGDDAALALLADLYSAQGRKNEAFSFYVLAVCANPSERRHKEKFIDVAGSIAVGSYNKSTDQAIIECLKTAGSLDYLKMQTIWSTHLLSIPEFQEAYNLGKRAAFDPANKDFFANIANFKPLFTPCFLLGIRHFIVCTQVFDEFITYIRRHLMADHGEEKKFNAEESVMLASAISHYAFNTDYILDCTEEEQKKIDALRSDIESGGKAPDDAASIALLACYMPLYKLKNSVCIADRLSSLPHLTEVIKTQIYDCDILRETAAGISAIGSFGDLTSAKVQEQYEEFPYPRWKSFSTDELIRSWNATGKNKEIGQGLRGNGTKILIAGCGTGKDSVALSALFPDADILAVDLSRSSLAYAINKAREYNIRNVAFKQADILQLGTLGRKFDYIVSGGVLHHMKDPVKGWSVLSGLLKPNGLMTIGLYSKRARWAVLRAQDVVKKGHHPSDTAGMRAFRRNGPQLLDKAVLADIIQFSDYYNLSMYRDLLFHVQESNYSLPEIGAILKKLRLDFAGFAKPPAVLEAYGKAYPGDIEKTNLGNWHDFEEKNPGSFKGMYLFWCRKTPD